MWGRGCESYVLVPATAAGDSTDGSEAGSQFFW